MKWRTRLAYRLLPSHTWGQIRSDWAINRRRLQNDPRKVRAMLEGRSGLQLHLGCGLRAVPGWINVDAFDQPGLDLRWDLRDRLPCEDGIAALIYSEHVLEHLEYDDAVAWLQELKRLLSPGGRIRLGMPDAELYLRAYANGDAAFFSRLQKIGNPSSPLDTRIKVINQMFRMGGAHRFAWDYETLAEQLARAGFTRISRWPPGQSSVAELCLDDPSHADETLYVEAERPAIARGNTSHGVSA
jgi:predicted SAM-dependent methyltransferase